MMDHMFRGTDIKLNGILIPVRGAEIGFERYNITDASRNAGGLMKIDLIAKKRKFTFDYEAISSIDMEKILDIIDKDEVPVFGSNQLIMEMTYVENGKDFKKKVYVGAIKYSKFRTNGAVWYWKNFAFDLIEQ